MLYLSWKGSKFKMSANSGTNTVHDAKLINMLKNMHFHFNDYYQ